MSDDENTTEIENTETAQPDPVEVPATVEFIAKVDRVKTHPLEWPVEVNGKQVSAVIIRRLTTSEVANFTDDLRRRRELDGENAFVRFPMVFFENGEIVTDAVFDSLDPDDTDAINEVVAGFLPRRFTLETAGKSEPTREAGNSTAP